MPITRTISTASPNDQGSIWFPQAITEVEGLWQRSMAWLNNVAGTANAITATCEGATINSYLQGQKFSFIAAATNTGPVTINIDSKGARAIRNSAGGALIAGDLVADRMYQIEDTGAHFRIMGAGERSLATLTEIAAGVGGGILDVTKGKALLDAFAPSPAADFITSWTYSTNVASVVFSNLGAYRNIYVLIVSLSSGNASSGLQIELSPNGTTWRSAAALCGVMAANDNFSADISIMDFGVAARRSRVVMRAAYTTDDTDVPVAAIPLNPTNVEAHSAIRLSWVSQNIDAGTILIYGDK